jgi:hypothetical protein
MSRLDDCLRTREKSHMMHVRRPIECSCAHKGKDSNLDTANRFVNRFILAVRA